MSDRTRIVSDADHEKTVQWLIDSAGDVGRAKKRAKLAEHMVKHVEALMTKASNATSQEARKNDARTSEKYLEAIQEDAEAAGELAKIYSLREAASARIETWRSEQANYRKTRV